MHIVIERRLDSHFTNNNKMTSQRKGEDYMKNLMNDNVVMLIVGGEQTETLPGGGFHGGEQTETLPGGGFHGGEQTETLLGGGDTSPPRGCKKY